MNDFLKYWWIIPLACYIILNISWVFMMIRGRLQGFGFAESPSELAEVFNVNLAGGIIIFILGVILCPLWNLLFWTYKLFYFLFHIGLED